jgi:sigma-B regulation protein RsbU (phosphoserine phosphatase)
MAASAAPRPGRAEQAVPRLIFVHGAERRLLKLERTPFTIGRKSDRDLVLADARVSREHAELQLQHGAYWVVDLGSRHGTFVNGMPVERHKLRRNDRIEFGTREAGHLIFDPEREDSALRELLSQFTGRQVGGRATDLENLSLFLQAARQLTASNILDEILTTVVETSIRLTGAERGFVFLRERDGRLRLATGRNAAGQRLEDDATISHSIVKEAMQSASEFVITDTHRESRFSGRQSIVAFDLRTVICIPLRRRRVHERSITDPVNGVAGETLGALYLDSRMASADISSVSHDILSAIATEAAALVENASLVEAEAETRKYQQELAVARSIQQELMRVSVPELRFASIRAKTIPCSEVGGDFYDVVVSDDAVNLVIADVSGKGISAALLGSILQGMIYSHLAMNSPLVEVATAVNRFLCAKELGGKYATLLIVRLTPFGELEYVNCGHLPIAVIQGGHIEKTQVSNLPVGLLQDIQFEAGAVRLTPGSRVIMLTDGISEAENPAGEFLSPELLEEASLSASPLDGILEAVNRFCGGMPLNDDCTIVELAYRG